MLTIQTWGGWGDVLREISLLPVRHLPRVQVRHLRAEPGELHAASGVPSSESVRQLVDRCPALAWGGEGGVTRVQKALARVARHGIERFHPGLFDPKFAWCAEDAVPLETDKKHIVVQTHLHGLPSKIWSLDNWRTVLDAIRALLPAACIHVLDPSGGKLAFDGVLHNQLTFLQAIRLVEQCDFLLSVDSWSKYVAAWKGIPQLVIIPDQTSDYPQLTATAVWRYSFRGLHTDTVKLVGLVPEGDRKARYAYGEMSTIRPEDVLTAFKIAGEKSQLSARPL